VIRKTLVAAIAALGAAAASAAPFSLANYRVTGNFALDRGPNDIGWEASAVTYAKDRVDPFTGTLGTLFFVGDEGRGVTEISRTGQTIGRMTFSAWPPESTNNDSEGLKGITIDENGTLYLVAEHEQSPENDNARSRLIVLSQVSEPGTLALLFGGLGALAWRARRQD
jgi:hypothetical protein